MTGRAVGLLCGVLNHFIMRAGFLFIAGLTAIGPAEAESGAVRDGRVEAELISKDGELIPGQTATVGLRLKMDEGWHTYWKNPGDSGMATAISWDLPDGYAAEEIDWPAPDYFEVSGLASFAYEGEVVLPVRISVPASATGDEVMLRATADWLVCKEACEPGTAELSLTLPVGSDTGGVDVPAKTIKLFASAGERQPELVRPEAQNAIATRGLYVLNVADSRFAEINDSGDASARFFPDRADVLAMSQEQTFTPTDDAGISVELAPNPRGDQPDRLTGVLAYHHGDDDIFLLIDAPLRSVAEGQ